MLLVKDRGFPWVEFMYPYPYPPKPLPLAEGTGFPGVRGQVFAKWWEQENIIVADAIIIPLIIPSVKTYYIMSRLRLKK